MYRSRTRGVLAFAISSLVVVIAGGVAFAATPSPKPPLPCNQMRFTGSAGATAVPCTATPTVGRGRPGLRGLRGFAGREGATGKTGAIGPIGSSGAVGPQGPSGAPGVTGLQGPSGLAGPTGPAGLPGLDGEQGPSGATGVVGATGATGATGAAGTNGPTTYAYIYNLAAQTVAIEADVLFDSNGVIVGGIAHAPGSNSIVLADAGDYKITFSVSGTEASQMALFVNGTAVAGGTYPSGAGTQQNGGQVIVNVPAGAVLTVRNHSSAAAVGLATPIGGTQASVNASVTIEKLSP